MSPPDVNCAYPGSLVTLPLLLILFTSNGNQSGIPATGEIVFAFTTAGATLSAALKGIIRLASPAPMSPKKPRLFIFGPPPPSANPIRPPSALPPGNLLGSI